MTSRGSHRCRGIKINKPPVDSLIRGLVEPDQQFVSVAVRLKPEQPRRANSVKDIMARVRALTFIQTASHWIIQSDHKAHARTVWISQMWVRRRKTNKCWLQFVIVSDVFQELRWCGWWPIVRRICVKDEGCLSCIEKDVQWDYNVLLLHTLGLSAELLGLQRSSTRSKSTHKQLSSLCVQALRIRRTQDIGVLWQNYMM